MLVRFRGDGDHTVCSVYGLSFPAGEWVDLSEPPRKLLSNPMFEAADPLDHDGDGRKGGSRRRRRGDVS